MLRNFLKSPEDLAAQSNKRFSDSPVRPAKKILKSKHRLSETGVHRTVDTLTPEELQQFVKLQSQQPPTISPPDSLQTGGSSLQAPTNSPDRANRISRARQPYDKGFIKDKERWDFIRAKKSSWLLPEKSPEGGREQQVHTDALLPTPALSTEDLYKMAPTLMVTDVLETDISAVNPEVLLRGVAEAPNEFNPEELKLVTMRLKNLCDLCATPLPPELATTELLTLGNIVQTQLHLMFDFCKKYDALLRLAQKGSYRGPEEEIFNFLQLWIGWYGKVYSSRLNRPLDKTQPVYLSYFKDGLTKCLPGFTYADNILEKIDYTLWVEFHQLLKKIYALLEHIPEEIFVQPAIQPALDKPAPPTYSAAAG